MNDLKTYLLLIAFLLMQTLVFAQNRSVAVVYDNSKSMTDAGQCEGINYAMQVLVGLLHPQDELFVFKMHPAAETAINLSGKQTAMQQVSATYDCLAVATPFTAVVKASSRLKSSLKKEKWLIILSDGDITEQNFHLTYPNELKTLVNQTGGRVIFLNVNPNNSVLDTHLANSGATTKTLRTQGNFTEIINTMEQVAGNIMSFSAGIQVQQQGNKAVFTSPVPLRRVIVLQQTSQPTSSLPNITKATAEGKSLTTDKSYKAKKARGSYSMSGNVTHLEAPLGLIPTGKVEIEFSSSFDMNRTKILPEAAAKLVTELTGGIKSRQGSLYKICDTVKTLLLTATLTDDNNQPLALEVLKKCIVQGINETNGQKTKLNFNEQSGKFSASVPVSGNKIVLSVSAEFTGYFNLLSSIYTLEKENCPVPNAGFDVAGGRAALRAKVTELDYAPSFTVIPKIIQDNGTSRPPTKEELQQLEIVQLNESDLHLSIKKQPDGTFTIRPTKRLCACFTPTGTDKLSFELRSKSPSIKTSANNRLDLEVTVEDDTFWAKCGWLIIALLVLLVVLWYIWGLIKKPRFCRGSEVIYSRETNMMKNKAKSYPLPNSFFKRYLIPYKPERQMVGSVQFIAGTRCSHVFIAAKSQNEFMTIMGMPLDKPNTKDERISNGEQLEIVRSNVKEKYEYRKLDNSGNLFA